MLVDFACLPIGIVKRWLQPEPTLAAFLPGYPVMLN